MGRKPERYKKELTKGEPRIKEIPYADVKAPGKPPLSSDKPEPAVTGMDWVDYRAWSGKFTPERQQESGTSDEDLTLHHKEVQALLDEDGEGYKIPFFSNWAVPLDSSFSNFNISVFVDEPGHLQVVYRKHDLLGLRGITWKTFNPPAVVPRLKKTIKAYNKKLQDKDKKNGNNEQMTIIFNQLLAIFKELDEHA